MRLDDGFNPTSLFLEQSVLSGCAAPKESSDRCFIGLEAQAERGDVWIRDSLVSCVSVLASDDLPVVVVTPFRCHPQLLDLGMCVLWQCGLACVLPFYSMTTLGGDSVVLRPVPMKTRIAWMGSGSKLVS